MVFIHTDSRSDRTRCSLAVACHHDDLFDPEFPEFFHDLRSFRTERILDADHSRQSSSDREIQVGVLCRECLKLLFLALRDHALLILKYEVVASDQNLILSDMGGNSMGHDIVDFGMHLLMDKPLLSGRRNYRVRHRVREVLFQTCGDP